MNATIPGTCVNGCGGPLHGFGRCRRCYEADRKAGLFDGLPPDRPKPIPFWNPGWTKYGRCGEVDPELWFRHGQTVDAREAKEICARCPVRLNCLGLALTIGEETSDPDGIWGGLTQRERRAIRRARQRKQTAPRDLPPKHRVPWTDEETAVAMSEDLTAEQVAQRLGRTVEAVTTKRGKLARAARQAA